MWEPRRLTTLWASTSCYRDSFTFIISWHENPLLGRDRETGDCTATLARKRPPGSRGMVFSKRSAKQQFSSNRRTVFFVWFVPRYYERDNCGEVGSNTSTMTLRVVGGDEKGRLKSETVTYDRESQGTRTRERLRWQGPAAYTNDRTVLSSERAPHRNKTVTVKQ
jgi:hypothetical protein